MDYEGKSILEQTTDPSTPAILAAIVVLQQEVQAIDGEIKAIQNEEKKTETRLGAIESKQAGMQTNLSILQTQMAFVQDEVSTLKAIAADTFSVVLTCPVSAQSATLTVPTGGERYFNYFGYAPNNSPFELHTYSGGTNIRLGTYGLIWTRPTDSQNLGATFEIDALATFFPNQGAQTFVNLRVQVRGDPLSAPMYDLVFNDRPFSDGSFQTWSMKRTITVPLKALGRFAETVTFDIMSSDGGYVYGVGGNYGMQQQLIVKRVG